MNKKRLEGIPHKIALINHSQLIMDAKDYQFLYKQAKRVQELDEQVYAIGETYRQEHQYSNKLYAENKRYREALMKVKLGSESDVIHYSTRLKSINKIAVEALEGESE